MTKNTRKTTSIATTILLTTSAFLALIAAAPGALAHDCSHEDPAANCGQCPADEAHNHRYANGSTYCTSTPCADDDLVEYLRCQVQRIIN